jgi:hypothetical protein
MSLQAETPPAAEIVRRNPREEILEVRNRCRAAACLVIALCQPQGPLPAPFLSPQVCEFYKFALKPGSKYSGTVSACLLRGTRKPQKAADAHASLPSSPQVVFDVKASDTNPAFVVSIRVDGNAGREAGGVRRTSSCLCRACTLDRIRSLLCAQAL